MSVIQGNAATKCWNIISYLTKKNGKIPPQTINTGRAIPIAARNLCKKNIYIIDIFLILQCTKHVFSGKAVDTY